MRGSSCVSGFEAGAAPASRQCTGASMTAIRGLDRVPGTAQEDLSDEALEAHHAFVHAEYEAETQRRKEARMEAVTLDEFAAQFADRVISPAVYQQAAALRAQAAELRKILEGPGFGESLDAGSTSDADDEPLVSNINEMTYDAGSLDSSAPTLGRWQRDDILRAVGVVMVVLAWLWGGGWDALAEAVSGDGDVVVQVADAAKPS